MCVYWVTISSLCFYHLSISISIAQYTHFTKQTRIDTSNSVMPIMEEAAEYASALNNIERIHAHNKVSLL